MNTNGSKCYFCHRELRNETAEQHSARCGYVLEPCVNKCGAYIPRNNRSQHLHVCRNTRLKSARSTESLLSATGYDTYPRASHLSNSSNASFVRTGTLPRSYKELPGPNYQYQYPENAMHNAAGYNMAPRAPEVNGKYEQLHEKFQRGHQQHADLIRQVELTLNKLRLDVQMVQGQNKTLVDWRTNVQYQLDGIVGEFRTMNANSKNDINTHRLQELSKDLVLLRNSLNSQQVTLVNAQVDAEKFRNDMEYKLKECENYFRQELHKLSEVNEGQTRQIDAFTARETQYNEVNLNLRTEIDALQNDLTSLKKHCTNLVETNKLQSGQINDLKTALAKINLNVEVAERSFENIQGLIATQPGRLLWKINDFDIKLENAKSNEKIPIRSPVFYTRDYGYRVRLQVHLNGLKKWRGRHMLACLHVMKGDYDDLLTWPCKIEANIILKDLENLEKPKDYARYITAKRNYPDDIADDPQESSTQYIFIPHTILLKSSHLKNNAVFLEIVINNAQ